MCIFHTRSVTIFIYNSYSLYLFFNACCKAKYYGLRDTSPLAYYFYLNECSFSLIFFTLQNVGKFISEHLERKFFRGSMPLDPPSSTSRLLRSCCTPLAYRDITLENLPLRLSHGLTPMLYLYSDVNIIFPTALNALTLHSYFQAIVHLFKAFVSARTQLAKPHD